MGTILNSTFSNKSVYSSFQKKVADGFHTELMKEKQQNFAAKTRKLDEVEMKNYERVRTDYLPPMLLILQITCIQHFSPFTCESFFFFLIRKYC